MNMFDSSFLCLDIGTQCVRGIAHHVKNGRLDGPKFHSVNNSNTVEAIKSVIDELEQKIGKHFDSAYITGNFGKAFFEISVKITNWNSNHKITATDIYNQISEVTKPENMFPMHIIPLQYDTYKIRNLLSPIGQTDRQLKSIYGCIFYPNAKLNEILGMLRRAHIQAISFYDPQLLQHTTFQSENKVAMYIDLGAQYTTVSIWTKRGPIWFDKIAFGGKNVTDKISETLKLDFAEADRIKSAVATMMPSNTDRFTPADPLYAFTRADINDIVLPCQIDLIDKIKREVEPIFVKYKPNKIFISGGGSDIKDIENFLENIFGIPVQNLGADATITALSNYIWAAQDEQRKAYFTRKERFDKFTQKFFAFFKHKSNKQSHFIPIMPSTLCFNMHSPNTYSLFNSAGISIIHVDMMDGLYVSDIQGSFDELSFIRKHTRAHLHVHLMTVNPEENAINAFKAGANTVIFSLNVNKNTLIKFHSAGRRIGVAINPETPLTVLKTILRDIDEVMFMGVTPGAAGQTFNPEILPKISNLARVRKKYKLRLTISVDGGINPQVAQLCWNAGADLLVSGSYLAKSSDFVSAVQSLLKKK